MSNPVKRLWYNTENLPECTCGYSAEGDWNCPVREYVEQMELAERAVIAFLVWCGS